MSLNWSHESQPRWDKDKQRIIGGAPAGALDISYSDGAELPGDWFAAVEGDQAVGYGWIDSTWGGDTEILLAVAPDAQGRGVGSFVMDRLEREAAQRGVNYVYNTVRDTHPDRDTVHDWLLVRGYRGNERDASLRKRVKLPETVDAAKPVAAAAAPQPDESALPPGREESGGYVDIENHQY
jgi:GNAT superfamily N-acetyltransferase